LSKEDQQDSLVTSGRYVVKLARAENELRDAQALRYQVFNVELDEGLECSHDQRLDVDKYDFQCDHLLVIERQTNKAIGTYRLQTYPKARQHHGFYTEDEFELDALPKTILENSVEVGRACIHREHRNGRVLYLLWRGIAEYIQMHDAGYLLGCCSLGSTDPGEGWVLMDFLRNNDHVHPKYILETKPDYLCPETEREAKAWQNVKAPELFRLYLDLGAKVLSKPALDKDFKTIDYLILVDIKDLGEDARALFFR